MRSRDGQTRASSTAFTVRRPRLHGHLGRNLRLYPGACPVPAMLASTWPKGGRAHEDTTTKSQAHEEELTQGFRQHGGRRRLALWDPVGAGRQGAWRCTVPEMRWKMEDGTWRHVHALHAPGRSGSPEPELRRRRRQQGQGARLNWPARACPARPRRETSVRLCARGRMACTIMCLPTGARHFREAAKTRLSLIKSFVNRLNEPARDLHIVAVNHSTDREPLT